jgi:hypothetical protein
MKPRFVADVARIAAVGLAALIALGSSSSSSQRQGAGYPPGYGGQPYAAQATRPPPPVPMEAAAALGLWKSSWGAVKIESDAQRGAGFVHGVFVYDSSGREVIGYFSGRLDGNVLDFTWEEPAVQGPLEGAGFLVFDPQGQRFSGRWWTASQDRAGEWTGSRQPAGYAPTPGEPLPSPGPDAPYSDPPPPPG